MTDDRCRAELPRRAVGGRIERLLARVRAGDPSELRAWAERHIDPRGWHAYQAELQDATHRTRPGAWLSGRMS